MPIMGFLPPYRKGALATPDGAEIPFVAIGNGPLPIVLLPGGSDGVATVADSARSLAWLYRRRARTQRLLAISRRHPLPAGYSLEQYAADFFWAIERLGWGPAVLECNSAGGPIGQYMAAEQPERVSGLILLNTAHRADDQMRAVFQRWAELARQRQWAELAWSALEHFIHPQPAAGYRPLRPLLRLTKGPRYPGRLVHIFEGMLMVDNRPLLPRIACPTLIAGGEEDRIFSARLQREMAALIPNSRLVLYPGCGHNYNLLHADRYNAQVADFVHGLLI